MTVISETLRQRLGTEVEANERLLWTGSPNPAKRAIKEGPPGVIFGSIFTLFALFWTAIAGGFRLLSYAMPGGGDGYSGPLPIFPFFGIVFVVVGLSILLSPVWAYLRAKRTVYGITNRCVIVSEGNALGSGRSVRSFGPNDIRQMKRRENEDGFGDLVFSRERYFTYHNGRSRGAVREHGFFAIPDVRDVERILRDTFLGGGYR